MSGYSIFNLRLYFYLLLHNIPNVVGMFQLQFVYHISMINLLNLILIFFSILRIQEVLQLKK